MIAVTKSSKIEQITNQKIRYKLNVCEKYKKLKERYITSYMNISKDFEK